MVRLSSMKTTNIENFPLDGIPPADTIFKVYQGLIKLPKVGVRGHATYVDGEIKDVAKNRFLA